MCDLGGLGGLGAAALLGGLFGFGAKEANEPDYGPALDLQKRALAEAEKTRKLTEDALARAEASMVDPRDSESARLASERAMRRRKSATDVFSGATLGPAAVGVTTLFGE
jgi:hypothetical protein